MTDKLKELQENELYILCYIAYCGDKLDYFSLVGFYTSQRIYNMDKNVFILLKAKGFTNFTMQEMGIFSACMINSNFYFYALHYLYTEHPEWVKDYQKTGGDGSRLFMVLRNAVANGLSKPDKIQPLQNKDMEAASPYLVSIAMDTELYQFTRLVPDSCFAAFYCHVLNYCIEADVTDKDDMLPKLMNERSEGLSDESRQFMKERLALYRYYAIGEYAPQGDGTHYYDCILRGLREAHLGKQKEALAYLSKALDMPHDIVKVKGTFYGPLENLFLMALYSHDGRAGLKMLTQFYKHRNTYIDQERYLPAFFIAMHEVDGRHDVSERWLEDLHIVGVKDNKKLYRALAIFFSNLWNKDIHPLFPQVYEPQMAILRFELSGFLDLPEEEQKVLCQKFGKSILLQERPMSRWEHVLCDLEEERNKAADDPNAHDAERSERIGYFLKWGKVEVRKQVRLKSGKWSAGKEIKTYEYNLRQKYMDNIDREICQRCGESTDHLDKGRILPYLIGTDRVYTGDSAPYAHVEIEAEKPYLIIHRKDDRFIVESNIPKVEDGKTDYVIKKTNMLYRVIRLSVSQMVYYQKLLLLKSFPLNAEKRLRDFLNRIGDVVEIHSDVIATNDDCETIESNGHLVVRITPQRYGGYLLNLFAKPLEGGTCYQEPGKGTSIIIDEKDGVRYQVKRKMKAELQHQEELFAYIEELTGKDPTRYVNTLEAQQLLDLLSYISDQDAIDAEWPEGEEIRVRNMRKQEPWNVSLREAAGWFEMEGEVHLDDEEVMDIARFLELSYDSHSNFVWLKGKEYLHLTESLRKQLNKLEAIATKVDGKMHISKMHTNLLAEAVNGELTVKHSDELENLQQQIHESFKLEVKKPRSLQASLRDYQMDGFQWMARLDSWGAGACLADDMGLGKTVQTIAMLLYKAKQGASLIVAPTSVVGNWRNELTKFAPSLEVFLVNEEDSQGRKAIVKKAKAQQVVLTTYGVLVNEAEVISKREWNIVCLDEAHTIKNKDTKMAQAAFGLQAHTRIALTGTPIQNHLGEVWSLFNFINPGMLGSYEGFQKKFVSQTEAGNKNRQHQLKRMLLPFILRRTKNEVIEELPDKTEVIRTVELSKDELNTYELIRKRAKKQLEDEGKVSVSVLAEITKLRQAACATSLVDKTLDFPSSKLAELSELVDDICNDGNRVLVFSQFTSFLELVRKEFDSKKLEYLYLDGSTSMRKRNELVKQFQEGDVPVFVISLKAGGLGLNLTGANYVIHCDPWWNPAIEQQATDRAYRIGQENKVTVYHLVSNHTIEQKIMRLHETKRNMADSLLDGSNVSHKLTEKELMEMLAG